MREGAKVVYAGDDITIGQGSLGKVLVITGAAAHVQWVDGLRSGQVDLVDSYDLSPVVSKEQPDRVIASQFDDSFGVPNFTDGSDLIRQAYDSMGEDGVIATLEDQGRLAVLASYANDALAQLVSGLRSDPALQGLLAHLDDDEREAVLTRLTSSLLDAEEVE